MKKFLLIALTMTALTPLLSAKELTFTMGGKDLPSGDTVIFDDYETLYWASMTEVYFEPKIYITKDSNGPVSIKTTSNYAVQLCIGGDCVASTEILKEDLTFNPGIPEDLRLECSVYFDKGAEIVLPAIEVEVEAWYADDPSNVTTLTVKMGDTASVDNLGSDSNSIRLVGNCLAYSVDKDVDLTVYDLAGQTVTSRRVEGSGTLSLENLSEGVYVYKAGRLTGKFIIR